MGRLTEDMTRLVGEIHAGRNDRGRLMQDLTYAAAEMKRAVAGLRGTFAADLAGARAAWLVARRSMRHALREAEEERRWLEAERQARDEAQMARKAGRRPRPR